MRLVECNFQSYRALRYWLISLLMASRLLSSCCLKWEYYNYQRTILRRRPLLVLESCWHRSCRASEIVHLLRYTLLHLIRGDSDQEFCGFVLAKRTPSLLTYSNYNNYKQTYSTSDNRPESNIAAFSIQLNFRVTTIHPVVITTATWYDAGILVVIF